ncbi:hypothetical protein SLEP1_g25245 [Rubroshorea leprosula]|uniref:Uncharacterized protein n=1 Tax=Rubroshorea leprosula TaxID=152421 RepID=A0AAV5JI33_9ROSI|nr:hypothetical protein SLEP1_g25245 [Rubroshorea leprosula]
MPPCATAVVSRADHSHHCKSREHHAPIIFNLSFATSSSNHCHIIYCHIIYCHVTLQERLEAFEGQQAQHQQDEPHELEEDTDDENPFHHLRDNESSSSTEKVRRRRRPQENAAPKSTDLGINIDILDFEASQGTQALKIVAETPAKVEKEASSSHPAQPNTRKSFKCQGFGHIASDRPNRRIITIIGGEIHQVLDGEAEKEINDEIKPQVEEELIAADHGESLVVRRSPHDTITKDEDKALISRSTFQKLHQESRTACLLLLSKVNDAISPFLEEIRSLLEEFSNVVPDETPHGLPRTQRNKDFFMVVSTRPDFQVTMESLVLLMLLTYLLTMRIMSTELKLEDEFSPTRGECTRKKTTSMQKLLCSTTRPVQLCQHGHNHVLTIVRLANLSDEPDNRIHRSEILNLAKIGVSVSTPTPKCQWRLRFWFYNI